MSHPSALHESRSECCLCVSFARSVLLSLSLVDQVVLVKNESPKPNQGSRTNTFPNEDGVHEIELDFVEGTYAVRKGNDGVAGSKAVGDSAGGAVAGGVDADLRSKTRRQQADFISQGSAPPTFLSNPPQKWLGVK